MVARRAGGTPLRVIAAALAMSHETLGRALRQEGTLRPPRSAAAPAAPRRARAHRLPERGRSRSITPEELPALIARQRAGESVRSLARSIGVSHETLRRALIGVTDT